MTADSRSRSDATTMPATRPRRALPRSADDARLEALPAGTRLHEFELQQVIGCGGFGIVYLARDHLLLRQVAIKEYLPVDFAQRLDGAVAPRTADDASTFAMGLRSFLREAQLLAGFDHPSLVKVHRFWEANGTAYMAMPYYAGSTLKEARKAMGAPPDGGWLREFLDALLSALEVLHDANVCHRDISPDNIVLLAQRRPVLLDFGSAREVVGDRTQALTAVFKPSFAAIEQYGDVPGLRQGPWTDLYALGGVMHFLITGAAPAPAAMRAVHDPQRPLQFAAAHTSVAPSLLRAIDRMLAVRPERRPASVRAVRELLEERTTSLPAATASPVASVDAPAAIAPSPARQDRLEAPPMRHTRIVAGLALAGLVLVAGAIVATRGGVAVRDTAPARAMPAAAPARSDAPAAEARAPQATTDDAPAPANPTSDERSVDAASQPAHAADRVRGREHAKRPAPSRVASTRGSAEPAGADPRAACADRGFMGRLVCLDRVCREPAYRTHPDCAAVQRSIDARRRRQEENR